MQSWLKELFEWYLSVSPAGPGQGTSWSLQWRSPWPQQFPSWTLVLLVPLSLLLVAAVYWIDVRRLKLPRRIILTGLRMAAIVCALGLLTETSLSVDRTGLPFLALMIDTSASMGLDAKGGNEKAAGNAPDRTRLGRVKQVLAAEPDNILNELSEHYRIRCYQFASDVRPLSAVGQDNEFDVATLKRAISRLEPDGMETAPAKALEHVLRDLRGFSPVGVIIFTDGAATLPETGSLSLGAAMARAQATQLFPVGTGSEVPLRDLSIADVMLDDVAFVGDPVRIAVRVRGTELAGWRSRVEIREEGADVPSVAAEYQLGDDPVTELELAYVPSTAGDINLVIETPVIPGEADQDNNRQFRRISVRDEKMRVLYVEGRPRYEYRALKHLLERQATIELHTVLQDADVAYAEQDRTALDGLPTTDEELGKYDVIIVGDVDPQLISPSSAERLREFVRVHGGGLVLIAGTEHNPWSFAGTPLESLLPMAAVSETRPLASAVDGFQPALTVHGRKGTGIFRFDGSEEQSAAVWSTLPPLYWYVPLERVKPGTTVFAEHPYRPAESGRLPLITMSRLGGGKVLFHATDETWRWRFRVGDVYYAHYWVQAIRYLSRSRLIGRDRSAELTTDRTVYDSGDNARFRLRFLDPRFLPEQSGATVVVEPRGGSSTEVLLEPLPEAPDILEGLLTKLPPGNYHAWVSRPEFDDTPPAADFRVEIPRRELQIRTLNRPDLEQAARISRGAYLGIDNLERLTELIPPGTPVPLKASNPIPLWSRWEPWFVVTMLLCTEWWLRNRWRLL